MRLASLSLALAVCTLTSYAQPGIWTQRASLADADRRSDAAGFSVDGIGYICTGYDPNDYTSDLFAYDPIADSWTPRASFPGSPRASAVGFSIGSKGYVCSGSYIIPGMMTAHGPEVEPELRGGDGSGVFDGLYEYDPATDSWSQKSNLPGGGRSNAMAFVIDGIAYVGTGYGDYDIDLQQYIYYNDLWAYDPVTDEWTEKAPYPGSGREGLVSFAINGKGYAGGGYNELYESYADFYEYDPVADAWTEKAPLQGGALGNGVGLAMDGTGYVTTGDYLGTSHALWAYDPTQDSWSAKADFAAPPGDYGRNGATGFTIGSSLYVGTGYDYTGGGEVFVLYPDLWEYQDCEPATIIGAISNSGPACDVTGVVELGVTATGTEPLTYVWSGGPVVDSSAPVTNTALPDAGIYDYTVTVSNACGSSEGYTQVYWAFPGQGTFSYSINGAPPVFCETVVATPELSPDFSFGGTFFGEFGLEVDPFSGETVVGGGSGAIPGDYTVTYTIPQPFGCPTFETTAPITITAEPLWWEDLDGDGYGDLFSELFGCEQPPGYVDNPNDQCPSDPAKFVPGICGCGAAEPGTPCNDGNATTENDAIGPNCLCTGTPICQSVEINDLTNSGLPCGSGSATLSAIVTGSEPITINWTGEGIFTDPTLPTVQAQVSTAGSYDYFISASNECSSVGITITWNYAQPSGFFLWNPLGGGVPPGAICELGTDAPPILVDLTPGGTFTGSSGLVVDPETGSVNAAASGVGAYTVTYTIPAGICPEFVVTANMSVYPAFIYYADQDNDGAGDPNTVFEVCFGQQPAGSVTTNNDGCPTDPDKIAPGICGCGTADTDSDNDGTANCNDGCPNDANKTAPGICGCGTADTDTDGDGIPNCNDNCPNVAGVQGTACNDNNVCTINDVLNANCVCAGTLNNADTDGDGVPNCSDNCPNVAGQQGSACDDGNGLTINDVLAANCVCLGTPVSCTVPGDCNDQDPCTNDACVANACVYTPITTDTDGDGVPNCADNCPNVIGQQGSACNDNNACTINDVLNANCVCAGTPDNTDTDSDGVPNCSDNCPLVAGQQGSACNDNNACTINDVLNASCVCAGTPDNTDTDSDGVPNCSDNCPLVAGQQGSACNDNLPLTINDALNANCVCTGTTVSCVLNGDCADNDACTTDACVANACVFTQLTADADGDGEPDCSDNCPNTAGQQGSACNDGIALTINDVLNANCVCAGTPVSCVVNGDCNDNDACTGNACVANACVYTPLPDVDGDGTCDAQDGCPNDPEKIAPGICGCGIADTDSDLDGTANCDDGCPGDPTKIAPGICGCGVSDADTDGDNLADCEDSCPAIVGQVGTPCDDNEDLTINDALNANCVCAGTPVSCAVAADCNDADPCTTDDCVANACVYTALPDGDNDGTCDAQDGCPADPDKVAPGLCGCGTPDTDTDSDGTPDCNDGCPIDPDKTAEGICGCGVSDADTDNDSAADCIDPCPDLADVLPGDACDDGNTLTVDDQYGANCVCAGNVVGCVVNGDCDDNDDCTSDACVANACVYTPLPDGDADGLCDAQDPCPALADLIAGDPCDDGNAATQDDVVGTDCICAGELTTAIAPAQGSTPLVRYDPSAGIIHVTSAEEGPMGLLDATGRMLRQERGPRIEFPVGQYPPGLYFLRSATFVERVMVY